MSRAGTRKEIRALAEQYGYELEVRRSGHARLVRPGWNFVTVSLSPSDSHALKNTEALLKRNQRKQAR